MKFKLTISTVRPRTHNDAVLRRPAKDEAVVGQEGGAGGQVRRGIRTHTGFVQPPRPECTVVQGTFFQRFV